MDGRCILDLAVDGLDNSLAVVTLEQESMNSAARVYEIGRIRSKVNRKLLVLLFENSCY